MTAPHFSCSVVRNAARRSLVFRLSAAGSAPSARSFVCSVRSASVAIAAAFKRATIGSGVAAGRNSAIQFDASKSCRPCSWAVATPGRLAARARQHGLRLQAVGIDVRLDGGDVGAEIVNLAGQGYVALQ